MKEKRLMTSFIIGGFGDVLTTMIGLRMGLTEANPFVNGLMGEDLQNEFWVYGAKILLYSLMILGYAWTKESNHRFSYSFEKANKVGNVLTWAVVGANVAQLLIR